MVDFNAESKNKYPKVLLTGGTGQVGGELLMALKPFGWIWAPSRKEFDLAAPESMRIKIEQFQPDLIVNPAAYTTVDLAESEVKLAYAINVTAPKVLAQEANRLGIPLIHYSTDYVFDGRKREPYSEEDEPCPLNVYGRTKLEGEKAVQTAHDCSLIFRTSWVYSTRGKNFFTTMQRLFREQSLVKVVDDQVGAPTSAHFLAETTAHVLGQLKGCKAENRWGIYHMTASGETSWFGFSNQIYSLLNRKKEVDIVPVATEDFPVIAKRPHYSLLNQEKLCNQFGVEIADWKSQLVELVREES